MLRGPWSRARRGYVFGVWLPVIAALALPGEALAQPVPPARLSVATDGTQANSGSFLEALTPDGRTVLFTSRANNLVPGDTNGPDSTDLFVRDRDTDRDGVLDEPGAVRTVRINEGIGGEQTGTNVVFEASISADSRFVLFSTPAPLVAGDTNGTWDVYLRDRDADADGALDEPGAVTLTRASTNTGGSQLDGSSNLGQMTPDGRYVLFRSGNQWYRKDRLTTVLTLVSATADGTPSNGSVAGIAMSPNGRFIAMAGGFPGIEAGSTPSATPWVLRDLGTGSFEPIATASDVPSRLPVTATLIGSWRGVNVGFSADSGTLYLDENTHLVSIGFFSISGALLQYDVASRRIVRRVPGIPPSITSGLIASAHTAGQAPLPLLYGESVSGGLCGSPGQGTEVGASNLDVYDPRTRRVTTIVPNRVGPAAGNADSTRIVYVDATCNAPSHGVFLLDRAFGVPLPLDPRFVPGRLDATGTTLVFTSADATLLGTGVDTNDAADIFAVDLPSRLDGDADGLDDRWEIAMGLDYASAAGADGPAGDPDGDGQTNLQEQAAGSHPRGAVRQFLAEGADNAFFKTRLAFANPGATAATAVVRLDGDPGLSKSVNVHVPAGAKRTVFVDEIGPPSGSFAAVVESSGPLVSERTMSWDAREYGAHAERASSAPATSWFLAEGATGAFSLFYLLQNPGDATATATIRYLRPAPLAPIERSYSLAPHSRTTLPVDQQASELVSTEVSASITATAPILVERAMYRTVGGQPFAAGHASAGVIAPATNWFLAEGATGPFFDLFVLLANPTTNDATVEIRYLLPDGTALTRSYDVLAESRRTIYVDAEDFPGLGHALDNVAVSCAITSTNGVPIVVERSMWFPGPAISPVFWTEAHNSPGATATARRWVLADGEAGGSKATQTYVLIANTSSTAGRVRVTALRDLAVTPTAPGQPIAVTLDLPANSRTTIPLHANQALSDTRFGVLVESIDTTPLADLVVERAMYWNAGGEIWAAGTNLLATPVP